MEARILYWTVVASAFRPLLVAGMILIASNSLWAGESTPAPTKKQNVKIEKKEKNPLSFWEGRLVFDVEERVRGELRENNRDFDSSVDDDNDDAWLLNRFRLGLAVKPSSWLKLYGQTQDAREAGSDRANIPGVRGAEGDDVFDLRQLSILIGDAKQFPLTLNVGRQLLTYGDSRLVADSKWSNFGRSFDAVKMRYEERDFWVEMFIARPVQIKRHDFDDSDAADNFRSEEHTS